jgi:WD40 repeat protein
MGTRRRHLLALIGALMLVAGSVRLAWHIFSSRTSGAAPRLHAGEIAPAILSVLILGTLGALWWSRRRVAAQINLQRAQGVQLGDRNIQHVHFHGPFGDRTPLAVAADRLADVMHTTWRAEAKARGISTPAPAMIRWRWGPEEIAARLTEVSVSAAAGVAPRTIPDPDPHRTPVVLGSGVVTRLHDEVYARLPHGRLVLLGAPGAGKTGAMILLLLAALDHREAVPEAQRGEVPIPVWLTLGGWDPMITSLREWALAVIVRDHPYLQASNHGPDAAAKLLQGGQLALFLDGLDEMPPGVRGKALERLDQESTALRMVLTSRPDEYRQALTEGRLHNTAVIEVRPVRPRAAANYLIRDQVGLQRSRWEQVAGYLQTRPDSVAAVALDNPLTLSLARSTYQHEDPTGLTDPERFPTTTALREHLIDRVLITAYPLDRQRAYARQWLCWIAHHMGPGRDLAWWQIPRWIPRWKLTLATALTAMLAGLITVMAGEIVLALLFPTSAFFVVPEEGLPQLRSVDPLLPGREVIEMYGLRTGLVGGLLLWLGSRLVARRVSGHSAEPPRLRPRLPQPGEFARLTRIVGTTTVGIGLAVGLTTGFGAVAWSAYGRAITDGLAAHVVDGRDFALALWSVLVVGLGVGVPAGLVFGLYDLWSVPLERAAASTPRTTYSEDRRTSTWVSVSAGLLVGLAIGLQLGVTFGLITGFCYGVIAGIGAGLVGRLVFGLVSTVEFAELILSRSVRRVRLMRLLEDALRRQVLRQAGSVYQFRHAELQDHLAKLYQSQHNVAPILSVSVRAPRRLSMPRTRGGRALGAITLAALLTAVLVAMKPIVTAMIDPDHITLTRTQASTLTYSHNGRLLAGSRTGKTVLWDLAVGRITQTLTGDTVGGAGSAFTPDVTVRGAGSAFSLDGKTLATADDATVHWWDVATGRNIRTLPVETGAEILAFSPDRKILTTLDPADGTVGLWDVATGKNTRNLPAWTPRDIRGDFSITLAFRPDGKALATLHDADGRVRVWDMATGRNTRTLADDPHWGDPAFSPDRKILATGSFGAGGKGYIVNVGGKVRLWDVATGRNTRILAADDDKLLTGTLAFSPDGKTLATGWVDVLHTSSGRNHYDYRVRLWDVATGTNTRTLAAGDGNSLHSLAFSPDGKTLATGWADDRVRLWDLTSRPSR